MTSDDLLKRLEKLVILDEVGSDNPLGRQAAARIRELQAQLPEGMEHCTIEFKECEHGHGRLVATNWVDHGCHVCRIRELEAELDAYARMWPAWKEVPDWQIRGVTKGTHVIVPVEPTEAMKRAALDYTDMPLKCWSAYISAAQPNASD